METLKSKIDFAVIFSVKGANPNGDPLNGNRPRVNYDGMGELSDVCLKRKIRNRLMEEGLAIFVQSDDNRVDEYQSLRNRAEGELKEAMDDEATFRVEACKKWIDVRAFGQVFAYKAKANKKGKKQKEEGEQNKGDEAGVSIGIRGPVSIHSAFSVAPVDVTSLQITKSVSGEGDGAKKASDTMGMKHRVDQGIYSFFGSMNPQLAEKTLFNDKDAEAIKQVLPKLFENDASSARPEGSMRVSKVIWWKHNCKSGQYSSAMVHKTLTVNPDGTYSLDKLEGLRPEEIDGF
ncbi:MAG: type I-C CRISPR-associated protein Cas7/Csd2 [Candidatus Omnitrophica bacterium]|jgi:CRISPR-associated protein Csd2|nr:type I-C CRISPR-associated protein Cas7/Csd2 [Candidatus Omnitrophota bacterium]